MIKIAIREIRKDKDEILYKKCKKVEEIDAKTLELIEDLKDTMYKYDGIGIASPQVGILKQILIYDIEYIEEEGVKNPKVLINPVITKYSKKIITTEEGCLSFPDYFGYVDRPDNVIVKGYNEKFEEVIIDAKGLEAVVLQHEIDHLNGKVFTEVAYDMYYGERPEELTQKYYGKSKSKKNNKKSKKQR